MRRMTILVAVIGLALAACGSDEPAATASGGPGAVALTVADTDLGPVLVGEGGMTLYMFAPDEGGTPSCYDQCAANWPPLVGDVTLGEGLDESLLGSVERTDGAVQVTYGGWPLYYFVNDAAAGDVNGQGVNDVWFVLDAAGEVVGA